MTGPDHSFSYPSYKYLADRVLLGKTSINDHIHLIKNSGLFRVTKLSADVCKDYLWQKYGHSITTNYPRGPAVYEINYHSPFWVVLKEKIDKGLKGTRLKVPQKAMARVLDLAFHSPKSQVTDSSKVAVGSEATQTNTADFPWQTSGRKNKQQLGHPDSPKNTTEKDKEEGVCPG
jgi:hypothetical protein